MTMKNFYKPGEEYTDSDSSFEGNRFVGSEDDDDIDDTDMDDEEDDSVGEILGDRTESVEATTSTGVASASTNQTGDIADEDEDDLVKAIVAATKAPRTHPPDIITEDFVVDLSFHPDKNLLAVGTITGDVLVYEYSNDENKLVHTFEVHTKGVRDVEFSISGDILFSTSKDKSVMLTDVETGKLSRFYDNAHEVPVYRMNVFDENLFATGDDDGTLKLWDLRDRGDQPIFSLKEVDDYISSILTNDAKKILLTTSGDGYLTAINIGARKLYVQSEPYDEELTCMGLFRNDSKLVVGSSKGRFYTYNWDEFGLHSNMFPGPKTPMSLMLPITDRICVCGGEEGILRAMHMVPGRNLGIVGQHSLGIEAIDICNSGEFIASSSHDNDIKFWNIKYFEDFDDIKYNEKQNKFREQRHNLPSSKFSNAGDFFSDML